MQKTGFKTLLIDVWGIALYTFPMLMLTLMIRHFF